VQFFVAKYTPEYKLEIIKKVLEDGKTFGELAREYQLDKADVQKWTAAYNIHGMAGLERRNNKYTGEFKQQVIEDLHTNKMSLRQAGAKYNLEHHIISKWERIYLEEGPQGLINDRRSCGSKGRPRQLPKQVEEDLVAEVQRLRAENDYLKKLNALVSERVQRTKKHKS
jgi:transposase